MDYSPSIDGTCMESVDNAKRLTGDAVTRWDPIPAFNFALTIRCLPDFGVHEAGRSADEIGG